MNWKIKNVLSLCFVISCVFPLWALNPIHEAEYAVWSRDKRPGGHTLSFGTHFDPGSGAALNVPVAFSYDASSRLELGVGAKTRWINSSDNIPWIVLGGKYKALGITYHLDYLFPTASGAGHGLSFGAHRRRAYTNILFYRATLKAGFFDALTNEALLAMEGAYYPTLQLGNTFAFEFGIMASSQTNAFDDNLAVDLQPAFYIYATHDIQLMGGFTFGIAGDRRESGRVKLALLHRL